MINTPGKIYVVRKYLPPNSNGHRGPGWVDFQGKNGVRIRIPYGDTVIATSFEKAVNNKRKFVAIWGNKEVHLLASKHRIDRWLVTPKTWEKLGHNKKLEAFIKNRQLYGTWLSCGLKERIPKEIRDQWP